MGYILSLFMPKSKVINHKKHNELFEYENDFDINPHLTNKCLQIENNIFNDPDIIWFYREYTLGRELWGINDVLNIWGLNKIYSEHLDNKINFSINEFYFADVMIWSHGLYFKHENGRYSVYVDYGPNRQVKVADDPKDFVKKLNENWDKTIYPD